jgi:hypothetical protein
MDSSFVEDHRRAERVSSHKSARHLPAKPGVEPASVEDMLKDSVVINTSCFDKMNFKRLLFGEPNEEIRYG